MVCWLCRVAFFAHIYALSLQWCHLFVHSYWMKQWHHNSAPLVKSGSSKEAWKLVPFPPLENIFSTVLLWVAWKEFFLRSPSCESQTLNIDTSSQHCPHSIICLLHLYRHGVYMWCWWNTYSIFVCFQKYIWFYCFHFNVVKKNKMSWACHSTSLCCAWGWLPVQPIENIHTRTTFLALWSTLWLLPSFTIMSPAIAGFKCAYCHLLYQSQGCFLFSFSTCNILAWQVLCKDLCRCNKQREKHKNKHSPNYLCK